MSQQSNSSVHSLAQMLNAAYIYISFWNESLYSGPTWNVHTIGKLFFTASTFHTAMCSLICCPNARYCIYQRRYPSALVYTFWVVRGSRRGNSLHLTVFFTSKAFSVSAPSRLRFPRFWPRWVSAPLRFKACWPHVSWHLLRNVTNAVCTALDQRCACTICTPDRPAFHPDVLGGHRGGFLSSLFGQ